MDANEYFVAVVVVVGGKVLSAQKDHWAVCGGTGLAVAEAHSTAEVLYLLWCGVSSFTSCAAIDVSANKKR